MERFKLIKNWLKKLLSVAGFLLISLGSEFKKIISETEGFYIYKFFKNNRFLWIVWNENAEPQRISLKLPAKESLWNNTGYPRETSR